MFSYRNAVIDINKSFGTDFCLKRIRPKYQYVDGAKTSSIEGYTYTVILLARGYEELDVSIPGACKLDAEIALKNPKVAFSNMKVTLYSRSGVPAVSVKADDVKVIA